MKKLEALGLQNVYHRSQGQLHGEETTKTYFHTKKLHFGHHIDYAFLGRKTASMAVGGPEEWLMYSDHMPLILDIEEA